MSEDNKKKKKKLQLNYLSPPIVAGWVEETFGGPADLDCCAHPQQFVKAAHHCYGGPGDDDGLVYDWTGLKVILNPSNGEKRPMDEDTKEPLALDFVWHPLSKWVTKAYISYQAGARALAVLPACTDNKRWFHTYVPDTSGVVLLRERIKSWVPGPVKSLHDEGTPVPCTQPNQAHMMALWTKDPKIHGRFMKAVSPHGIALSFQVPEGYDPEDYED